MKPSFQMAIAAVFSLAVAGAAVAQPAGNGGVRKACAADMQKLCPDAKPGPGGGLRQCMMSHQNELSDPCKSAIVQMRAARMQSNGAGGPTQ